MEDEKQEKTLAKLHWLIERTKPDFKGNPNQFELPKTMKSVEKQRDARKAALAGETEFLPFHHSRDPLAMTAVKQGYLKGYDNSKFEAIRQAKQLERNRVDPKTGLSEIRLALTWNEDPPVPYQYGTEMNNGTLQSSRRQLKGSTALDELSPSEKLAIFREEMLNHPKHTFASAHGHRERWLSGSQLAEVLEKPKKAPNKRTTHRNAIRIAY